MLKYINNKLRAHEAAKADSIERKILGRYADKFHQDENGEMKPDCYI